LRFLRHVLRVYSYLFELALCGMGLLLSIFGMVNRNLAVGVPWLPWSGPDGLKWLLGTSLLGLLCVFLAVIGTARILLFFFSGAVVYILVKGLFINTQYAFANQEAARNALLLVIAAIVAFLGAIPMARKRHGTQRTGRI
jgi:hypothetical protein